MLSSLSRCSVSTDLRFLTETCTSSPKTIRTISFWMDCSERSKLLKSNTVRKTPSLFPDNSKSMSIGRRRCSVHSPFCVVAKRIILIFMSRLLAFIEDLSLIIGFNISSTSSLALFELL